MATTEVSSLDAITDAILARITPMTGVRAAVQDAAEKIAVVAESLQQGPLEGTVSIEMRTMRQMGIAPVSTPVANITFAGPKWGTEGHEVAGAPNSGKDAIQHFAKG